MKRHAILIGSNGLVGKEILKELINNDTYYKITTIGRSYKEYENPKIEEVIVNFNDLHKSWNEFKCDDLFYCIGTTMSKAKKKEEFRKVEYNYCINIAKIAHHNKINQFFLISSKGANPNSIFYYTKIKGEIEQELLKLNFPSLKIFRPSVLFGKRKEFRFLEFLSILYLKAFNFLMFGPLKEIKGMPTTLLSKVMVTEAIMYNKEKRIFTNRDIHEYFKK